MAAKKRPSLKELSDQAIVERVQSILINAAEGRRSVGDDAQYDKLRRELIRRPFSTPPLVSTHPSVDSFSAFIRQLEVGGVNRRATHSLAGSSGFTKAGSTRTAKLLQPQLQKSLNSAWSSWSRRRFGAGYWHLWGMNSFQNAARAGPFSISRCYATVRIGSMSESEGWWRHPPSQGIQNMLPIL
jgi:hypothetical protein